MKRYLVYYKRSPEGGIDAGDYGIALRRAKSRAPREHKRYIRVRLARPDTLLGALARQKEYGH